MKYIRYIKGEEAFNGYMSMHGLQVVSLGEYQDRLIWLCYHPQNGNKNLLAIARHIGELLYYDVVADNVFNSTIVQIDDTNKGITIVDNIASFVEPAKRAAKFIYDMDNNRL